MYIKDQAKYIRILACMHTILHITEKHIRCTFVSIQHFLGDEIREKSNFQLIFAIGGLTSQEKAP